MVVLVFASTGKRMEIDIEREVTARRIIRMLSQKTGKPMLSFVLTRDNKLLSDDDLVSPSDTIIVYVVGSTG